MPGTERIGRYELVAHLAAGGMGQVYLARTTGLGGFVRHVVLKTLDLPGTDEDEAIAMFLDEARLLGLLHHQHIAPIYEVGKEDGHFFLVMDYIHGQTAHDVWQRTNELGAALPIDFSLTVAAAAASGLHYAHTRRDPDGRSLRIVHRDVTLSNLMIGFDGAVKLIDFGIAKAANRSTQTQVGFIKGKIGYMAPEQLRGQEVDARTDVFALGIVLYELSTMRRAFREDSDRATMERIKAGALVPPKAINPDYPPELERIVTRALRVDPRERHPDTEAMRRELDLLGHQLGLVLGDAAIVEVMSQLFELRHEPWQQPRPARAPTELEVPLEIVPSAPHENQTRPIPSLRRGATLRAATEAAESQLETPPHGLPKRPSSFSITFDAGKAGPTNDTDGVAAVSGVTGAVASLSNTTDSVASVSNDTIAVASLSVDTDSMTSLRSDTEAVTVLRSDTEAAAGVSNDTDGVLVMPAPARPPAAIGADEPGRGGRRAGAVEAPADAPAPASKARAKRGPQPLPAIQPLPTSSPPARPSRRSAVIGWTVFSVLAAAAIASGIYVLLSSDTPSQAGSADRPGLSNTPPSAPPVIDAAPPKPPPAPPPSTQVNLRITTTPPDATVLLDGKRLGRTPYTGTIDAAPGTHTLKIRRRGYVSVALDIELAGDVTREIALQRAKADPAPGPAPPPP